MQKGIKFIFAVSDSFPVLRFPQFSAPLIMWRQTAMITIPGTFELPWLTIGKAASVMVAGDTTYIRGGTYNVTSSITPANSGSAAAGYITFSAYQNEVPIIDGGGLAFQGFYPDFGTQLFPVGWPYYTKYGHRQRSSRRNRNCKRLSVLSALILIILRYSTALWMTVRVPA